MHAQTLSYISPKFHIEFVNGGWLDVFWLRKWFVAGVFHYIVLLFFFTMCPLRKLQRVQLPLVQQLVKFVCLVPTI